MNSFVYFLDIGAPLPGSGPFYCFGVSTNSGEPQAEIADLTAFVVERRLSRETYRDWSDPDWRSFAPEQLLRDDIAEDVEYTLDDARGSSNVGPPQ